MNENDAVQSTRKYADGVIVRTTMSLSIADRIRVLFGASIIVITHTQTENVVGYVFTTSQAWVSRLRSSEPPMTATTALPTGPV